MNKGSQETDTDYHPTSCNVCGSGCTQNVDTTKYNPSYSCYATAGSHKDCANYLSQALSAGGIPKDNTWYADSSAWIGVAALTNYMVDNGYWTAISYTNAGYGDILRAPLPESHIVMITSFDGTTYKYSGHTKDRLNYTISISSSSGTFYRVGMP